MKRESNDPLRGFLAVPAPRGVGERVLARVRAHPEAHCRPSVVDRLWYSRGLRLAWGVAVLALGGANVMLYEASSPEPSVTRVVLHSEGFGDDPVLTALAATRGQDVEGDRPTLEQLSELPI